MIDKRFLFMILFLSVSVCIFPYTLGEMIDLLDGRNSSLTDHRLEIEARRYDTFKARAARFPTIDAEILASYIGNPMGPVVVYPDEILAGIDWPAGMEPSTSGGPVEIYGGQESTYYQFNLSVTQPIFTWGKINDAIELSEIGVEVQRYQLQLERKTLVTRLKILLESLWYLQQMEGLIDEQIDLVSRLVDLAGKSFSQGFILKDEVLSAEIGLHEAEMARDTLTLQIETICNDIGKLLGVTGFEPASSEYVPDIMMMEETETSGLRVLSADEILSGQPAIALTESLISLQQTASRIKENTIYWKPDFALRFDIGYAGPRFPLIETDWYRQDDYSLNATVALRTTVWDGGTQLIDQASAALSIEDALNSRISAEREILYTYEQAVSDLEFSQANIEYLKKRISVDEESLSFKEQQYANGIGMESDVIRERLDLLSSRLELFRAYIDLSTQYHTVQSLLLGFTN